MSAGRTPRSPARTGRTQSSSAQNAASEPITPAARIAQNMRRWSTPARSAILNPSSCTGMGWLR